MEQVVLVCGGRDYADRSSLYVVLNAAHSANPIKRLIAGGANGADALAVDWARSKNIPHTMFNADWEKHGRKAGPLRNQEMLDRGKPDIVIAFPGGRGTADMKKRAKAAGVPVVTITK